MKTLLGIAALAFGLYFAGCEVYGTYEFWLKDQGGFSYIVAAASGIAAAASLLPAWAAIAWRGQKTLSFALWTLFLASSLSVVVAAAARTGLATDSAEADRETRDRARIVAFQNDASARTQLVTDMRTVERECETGHGPRCKDARAALGTTQQRVSAAGSALMVAPATQSDPLARRIAAVFPVTEVQVRLYQPLAVPVLTSALSAALIALGVWLMGAQRFSVMSAPRAQEPLHVQVAASDEPLKQITSGEAQKEIARFATARIKRDAGGKACMREIILAYEDHCAREVEPPVERAEFVRAFADLCERVGIEIKLDGRDAYCVDARLVA